MTRYRLELELELAEPDDEALELLAHEVAALVPQTSVRVQVWREAERPWLTSVLTFAWGRAVERRQGARA